MREALLKSLSVACLLLLAGLSHASAQQAGAGERRAAIKELIELTGAQKRSAALYEELISRYQAKWPDAVIAGFKADGLFRNIPAKETAEMEKLIHEFGDNSFGEIKKRVIGEVMRAETFVSLSEPVIGKYFDDAEIQELVAFSRTPAAQKFYELYGREVQDSITSTLVAKGVFEISPSPDREMAKLDGFMKSGRSTLAEVHRAIAARMPALLTRFTPEELRQIAAFGQTPLGQKLARLSPMMMEEIYALNVSTYAPRMGAIAGEVINQQMEMFARRTNEILKGIGPRKN